MARRLIGLFASALFVPAVSMGAGTWSVCQSVSAVTNYISYSGTVMLILYPGVPGCASDAPGAVMFRGGEFGVTTATLNGHLATAMSAYLSGKRIMVYYDNATPYCFANAISVGGSFAQCN